jgi:hypothetical protein
MKNFKIIVMVARYRTSGLLTLGLFAAISPLFGQGLVNENAKISVTSGTFLIVKDGGFTNNGTGGQVTNAGTLEVDGNWTNNSTSNVFGASPTVSTGGSVVLNGTSQTIGGTESTNFFDLSAAGSSPSVKDLGIDASVFHVLNISNGIRVGLNSNTLTLEKTNPNALQVVGNGGVIAETGPDLGYGYVNWRIRNDTAANYTLPFRTDATNFAIPVTYNIVSAGTGVFFNDQYKRFSTYPTDDTNSPEPTVPSDPSIEAYITNMSSIPNSNKVIDRFWIVDDKSTLNYPYTFPTINQYPNVNLTFTIDPADHQAPNAITASNLVAQRFNHVDLQWGDWLYPFNSLNPNPGTGSTFTVNLTRIEDYFPIWTLVDNSDPLPIELARFVGQCQGGDVLISWTTFTETNNDFFTVERSKNGVDFEVVDVIAAAGNSNSPITYQLLDESSFGGTSYYRLKNTDFFGKEEYSQIIAVTCGQELTDFTFVNAYDIDNRDLMVEFTAALNESYTITLFDASGRMIMNNGGKAVDGMNKVRLPAGNLSQGIYIINLQNDSKRFSKKVMLR